MSVQLRSFVTKQNSLISIWNHCFNLLTFEIMDICNSVDQTVFNYLIRSRTTTQNKVWIKVHNAILKRIKFLLFSQEFWCQCFYGNSRLQGNLYTGEVDGIACAVVNQLWAWLFNNCKNIFSNTPTANSTVGWQLHNRYSDLPPV